MKFLHIMWLGITLSALGCGGLSDPQEDPGLAPSDKGVVSGEVLVPPPAPAPYGVTLMLLPIDLTTGAVGGPANITVVTTDALTAAQPAASESPYLTADYTIPLVKPGTYLIVGYNNYVLGTAPPANPDGAYVDASGNPTIVTVEGGDVLEQINVFFSPPAPEPTPSPSPSESPTP